MKTNITLTAAALFLGMIFSVNAGGTVTDEKPADKKECAQKVMNREYVKKCPKRCMKHTSCCAGCGAPMVVVYEMDDFFAIPENNAQKTSAHAKTEHHAKPAMRKSVVKPVMHKGKDGKPEQIGYLVLFVDEGIAEPPAAPAQPAKK